MAAKRCWLIIHFYNSPQNEKCRNKLFKIAVAEVLVDTESCLGVIYYICAFCWNHVKYHIPICPTSPVPLKKIFQTFILLVLFFLELKYLITCIGSVCLVLCRSKLFREREKAFVFVALRLFDLNTDLLEWNKPVLVYSIWLNCADVNEAI